MTTRKLFSRPGARPARFFGRNIERGDGDTFEFIVGVLPIAMMMALIGAVAVIRPAQLPVWIAARECARMASASLDPAIAVAQGQRAGLNSLLKNPLAGYTPSLADVQVTYNVEGAADPRGQTVTCRVGYTMQLASLPLIGGLFGNVPMDASVSMQIEPLKSNWR